MTVAEFFGQEYTDLKALYVAKLDADTAYDTHFKTFKSTAVQTKLQTYKAAYAAWYTLSITETPDETDLKSKLAKITDAKDDLKADKTVKFDIIDATATTQANYDKNLKDKFVIKRPNKKCAADDSGKSL